ncbi:MAG: flagellar biosynthesis protein FlgN [Treponema sp.]|jgi:predicted phage gp36 major capsid-like protein|nr:flagellar biosynthesis protein FlgN [Treponema sp.]
MAESQLSQEELNRRVAILRRFRALLAEQRDRFRAYLEELDRQKDVIERGSAEQLIAHVELEEKIVADIFAIQKVIDPMDEMYRAAGGPPAGGPAFKTDEVRGLNSALEDLKREAAVRSSRNKGILSRRMAEIREEIESLRANPRRPGGAYSAGNRAPLPALIDISG